MATMADASETYYNPHSAFAPSTPANGSRSHLYLSPDHAVASSPLLKDDEHSAPRRGLILSERTSRASSIRLSKDLENLRWNGSNFDDSDLLEDDGFLKPEDEADMLVSDDSRRASMVDGGDGLVLSRTDTGELNSYSALSKRADFILASAKRKLNLLEGDIKGARHSLLSPPRTNYPLTPSNSLRHPSSNQQSKEDPPYGQPARPSSAGPADPEETALTRAAHGHTRVFSEPSVPSPRGPAFKGSLGLEHVRDRHPLQNSVTNFNNDRSLGPVIEDEVPTDWNHDEQITGNTGVESTSAISNAQILRTEAEDLKERLSQIQERVRNDARKRQSWQGPVTNGSSRDGSIAQQIQALKQSLDQQEEVIEQLERAEGAGVVENGEVQAYRTRDAREEWQQILEHDEDRYNEDLDSPNEYSEDEDAEFESVLEQQQFEEEDADMDRAHEDRADAFDYEHFILHSVLGSYSNTMDSRRSSSTSTRSNSTERGNAEQEFEDATAESDNRRPKQLQHEESIASFATAQQGTSEFETDSESEEEEEDANNEDRPQSIQDEDGNSWPMPPSSNGSRQVSTVFSDSGQAAATSRHSSDPEIRYGRSPLTGHRPASRIFSALMGPASKSSLLPQLEDDDQSLVYALSEALRHACVKLRRCPASEEEGIEWRQRMEQARKILAGEPDIPL